MKSKRAFRLGAGNKGRRNAAAGVARASSPVRFCAFTPTATRNQLHSPIRPLFGLWSFSGLELSSRRSRTKVDGRWELSIARLLFVSFVPFVCMRDCGLWTVDCGLETGDCGLWTGDCGLWTGDWRLWTVDWRLWTVDFPRTCFTPNVTTAWTGPAKMAFNYLQVNSVRLCSSRSRVTNVSRSNNNLWSSD